MFERTGEESLGGRPRALRASTREIETRETLERVSYTLRAEDEPAPYEIDTVYYRES